MKGAKMNASGTGKNGRIELLRFVFALFILFFHIHKRFATEAGDAGLFFRFFHHGYIGVEFFFLVSGFLLAAAASRQIGKENGSIGAETVRVTFSRIKKVFPYHLFALIVTMVVNVILIPI